SGCARGFTFDSAKSIFVHQVLCPLLNSTSSFGDEIMSGSALFSTPGEVSLNAQKGSCPGHPPIRGKVSVTVSGDRLTIGFANGFSIFVKAPTGGMAPASAMVS